MNGTNQLRVGRSFHRETIRPRRVVFYPVANRPSAATLRLPASDVWHLASNILDQLRLNRAESGLKFKKFPPLTRLLVVRNFNKRGWPPDLPKSPSANRGELRLIAPDCAGLTGGGGSAGHISQFHQSSQCAGSRAYSCLKKFSLFGHSAFGVRCSPSYHAEASEGGSALRILPSPGSHSSANHSPAFLSHGFSASKFFIPLIAFRTQTFIVRSIHAEK